MKRTLHAFILLFFSINTFSQVNVLWEQRYTSAGNNTDIASVLVQDSNGDIIISGSSFNGTNYDIVTRKYDPAGVLLWTNTFNGSGNGMDMARSIAVDDSNNVYVVGLTTSTGNNTDYITIKYASSGSQVWTRTYNNGGYDEAYAVITDGTNIYVTGGSDNGSQGSNFYTIKYDNNGNTIWGMSYNGPANSIDAATQIAKDNFGNIYVAGHSMSANDLDYRIIKYNSSGGVVWNASYNNAAVNSFDIPYAIYVDAATNVYVTGASYGGQLNGDDIATVMYNASGTQQWVKRFNGTQSDNDVGNDIIVDANGDVYITGKTFGNGGQAENFITIKYSATGNMLWMQEYNGPNSAYDEGKEIEISPSGYLYATGYSVGNGTNNDYLTLKMDTSTGNIIWRARFDGPASNSDQAFAMELDAFENIYVAGTSKDPMSGQDYSLIKWCQFETIGGNDTTICQGDTVFLNATATNGTNFVWTPSTGLSNPNIANPVAYPLTTTQYVVSSTNTITGCVDYDTLVITVNPLPNATITPNGPTNFCAGGSVMLTAATNTTYNWNTSDTTQSITVNSQGTYSVVVVDSNGCSNYDEITIGVYNNPPVSAGADTSICDGNSVMLNATGATNYTWNTQSTLSDSTIANPIASPTNTTTYWVTGSDINGCSATDTVTVTVYQAPTASFLQSADTVYLNISGSVGFISTSTGATTYSWDFGDGNNGTGANTNHTYTAPGTYTVILTASNSNCSDYDTSTVVVIQSNSINELDNEGLVKVYPNPNNGAFTIYIDFNSLTDYQLDVYDITGKSVYIEKGAVKTFKKTLELSLPKGLYFVNAKTLQKNYTTKIVVQ